MHPLKLLFIFKKVNDKKHSKGRQQKIQEKMLVKKLLKLYIIQLKTKWGKLI